MPGLSVIVKLHNSNASGGGDSQKKVTPGIACEVARKSKIAIIVAASKAQVFAGLPALPKPAAKPSAKAAAVAGRVPIREVFTLAAPPAPDEFSIRLTMPDPPMRLIDIRRLEVTPFLAAVSMFTAPPPDAGRLVGVLGK